MTNTEGPESFKITPGEGAGFPLVPGKTPASASGGGRRTAENEKGLARSEALVEDKNESWDREQCGHIAGRV